MSSDEDPVLATIRLARLRPLLPESKRELLTALDAEATSDPSTWQGLMDEVAALAPDE